MTPTMIASRMAITTAPMIIRPVTSIRGRSWSTTGVPFTVSPKSPVTTPESQRQYRTKKLSFRPSVSRRLLKNDSGGRGFCV